MWFLAVLYVFAKCSYLVLLLSTAIRTLVEKRITGFPVIDDDWTLVCIPSLVACFFFSPDVM